MGRHALVSLEPGQHNPKRQRGKKQQPRNFYENSLPWKNKFQLGPTDHKKIYIFEKHGNEDCNDKWGGPGISGEEGAVLQ